MQRFILVEESMNGELVLTLDVATAQLLVGSIAVNVQHINECVCDILLENGKKRLAEFNSYPLDEV